MTINTGRVATRAEALRNRGRRLDAQHRAERTERMREEGKKRDRAARASRVREQALQAHRANLRDEGRRRDQIEQCYRQYTPAQHTVVESIPWEDLAS